MNRKIFIGTICCAAGLVLAQPSVAQTTNKFTFNVGAGFTEPVRNYGRLDVGFNFVAAGGANLTPHFGVLAEFGYNQLGVTSRALSVIGAPDGASRIYSVTLNPIVHFNPHGRFDAYVVGGGGFYRRTIEFTEPTIATATFFDPFYGVFYPAAVPANTVLGSFTQNKGGLNIGMGLEGRLREDGQTKFFAEARYHYIYTSPRATKMLPVTFGFRW
jgi:opacity protein-like surface antigen